MIQLNRPLAHRADQPRRTKVLLLAYAATPAQGSESGVGWNRALQTARFCDTWVICEEEECSADIRRYTEEHGEIPGLEFHYLAKSSWEKRIAAIPGGYYMAYNLWHRRALRLARDLHAQVDFDLAHQAVLCGYREPGYLWKLGIPFIWGPVGGTQNYPWRFLREAGIRGALLEGLRSVLNRLQLSCSLRVRRAAQRAHVVLTANTTNQRDFQRFLGVDPQVLLETGLPTANFAPQPADRTHDELRIVWSGEVCRWKALSLLIKALAALPRDVQYRLRVLGDGHDLPRMKRLAAESGVAEHIEWLGWVSDWERAVAEFEWADVVVFTSLRDTSGNVVLEAFGRGTPVVCLDHQGVRDMVTDRCGIKVPVTTPREVVDHLRQALNQLAHDRELLQQLSRGAVERAREFLWPKMGESMAQIYQQVCPTSRGQCRVDPHEPLTRIEVAKDRLKSATKVVAGRLGAGMNRLCGSHAAQPLGILVYHRIAPRVRGVQKPIFNVPPSKFHAQLSGLLAQGYNFWPLSRVLQFRNRGEPIPEKTVVVTFDDGFENVYTNAWPVLRELKVPATVFLNTAYLGGDGPFPFDPWAIANRHQVPVNSFRALSLDQCHELLQGGLVELGAHTHTHQDFRARTAAFEQDLAINVEFLRQEFRLTEVTFAFPFGKPCLGYVNDDLVTAARQVGVCCALTTEDRLVDPQTDPFTWGRFNVYDFDSASTLAGKLNGWYSWAPRVQEFLLPNSG